MRLVVLEASSEEAEICFTSPVAGSLTSKGEEVAEPVAIGLRLRLEIEVVARLLVPVAVRLPVVTEGELTGPLVVRLVKVALVPTRLVIVALVPTMLARVAVPVAVMLVPVALPKRRFWI